MKINIQLIDEHEGELDRVTEIEADLWDTQYENEAVHYGNVVSQGINALRGVLLAAYGYDKAEIWKPILDVVPDNA